jgi:hypothetical protein
VADLQTEESAVSTSVHDRTEAIVAAADDVVQRATPGVPGVVAGITDHWAHPVSGVSAPTSR